MRRRDQYKHLLNSISNFILMLIQTAMFAFVWYEIYEPSLKHHFFRRGNWAVIGIYMLFVYFFTHFFGGYKIGYLRITDICLSQILGICCANVVAYIEVCMVARKYLLPVPIMALTLAEAAVIIPFVFFVRYIYVRLYPPRKMIVIYGNYPPDELIAKINTRKDKYNICASISYCVGYEKLYPLMKEYQAVVLCDLPAQARNQIMKYCYQESIRMYVTPKISDVILRGAENIHLFDTPLLLSRSQGLSVDQRFFKRIMDVVFSAAGILLFSPFMLLTALAIKCYDRGPVFYTQERLTRDGERFSIIKFRSMSVDSEQKGARLAAKNDARVTPVGKLIRRIHFDEVPQLFNILKGDMSIVGPRPEREVIAEKYMKKIPEFVLRLKVKAGLTGYAQVYGKYNTTPYDKVKLDISYIENYSIWLDFKLLLMTVKVIFQKENTEGVAKDQETAIKEVQRNEKNS